MHTGQKTDPGMLSHRVVVPQSQALESVSADNPGVGTKRDTEALSGASGMQHGQGEQAGDKSPASTPSEDLRVGSLEAGSNPSSTCTPQPRVFVVDKYHRPLDSCHPARAKELLRKGRAVVHRYTPFVIRLKDRVLEDSVTHPHVLGVDPGSRSTGLAVARQVETVDTDTGEISEHREPLVLAELGHRGGQVRKKMTQRAGYRRRRRSKNLRYRAPRFDNRRSARELAPSLQSRVDNTLSWAGRFRKWVPDLSLVVETARFDTQLMQTPEISGVEYQQGELAGFEVREYVLHRDCHTCVYCDATGVVLNMDHVLARVRGGSDRVSNLAASCVDCNKAKGSMPVEEFVTNLARLARIRKNLKAGLRDAAWMNATRYSLVRQLRERGHQVSTSTGARTKYTRTRLGVPKSHALDALCVWEPESVGAWPSQVLGITATSRGSYARTLVDKCGFPRGYRSRQKKFFGFATGDYVQAIVPAGKKAGTHIGRIGVRKSGSMLVGAIDGINQKHIRLLQPADGYAYTLMKGTRDSSPGLKPGGSSRGKR